MPRPQPTPLHVRCRRALATPRGSGAELEEALLEVIYADQPYFAAYEVRIAPAPTSNGAASAR